MVQFEVRLIVPWKDSSPLPECVKNSSEPFDVAQGERISTWILMSHPVRGERRRTMKLVFTRSVCSK